MLRHYVSVGDRQVLYRRAGSGPPVVLCHESPLSSASLTDLAQALASRFTVLALDTPGYGGSDPLGHPTPEIEDYADALADTLTALGVERAGVYGAHTGASIALELACRHPQRVSVAVLDGLPIFTAQEREDLLANYLPLWPPRISGGHLLDIWARYRDQHLFFPWYRRSAAARIDIEMPPARALHEGFLDFLRAGDGYRVAYGAAFRHLTLDRLPDAQVPVWVVAREDDLLRPQLERMPAGTRTEVLPRERSAWAKRLGDLFATGGPAEPAPQPRTESIPGGVTRSFTTTRGGQLLTRHVGSGGERPLVMLHQSPTSAAILLPLQRALTRATVSFDTLGNGDSDTPPWGAAQSAIVRYAEVVADAVDALGLDRIDLYGMHTGSFIAVETALLLGDRVRSLVLEGMPIWDAPFRADLLAHYLPDLAPCDDGSHLPAAWNFYRDQTLFWPFYDRTRGGIRHVEPASAEDLHTNVVELLKCADTFHLAYRAVFAYDPRERLPALAQRTLVYTTVDDMLARWNEEAAALIPRGSTLRVAADYAAKAAAVEAFLDASAG